MLCFAHHPHSYYPGTGYLFTQTEWKRQRIPRQTKMEKRVLAPRAKLNRLFGRGILTMFFVVEQSQRQMKGIYKTGKYLHSAQQMCPYTVTFHG